MTIKRGKQTFRLTDISEQPFNPTKQDCRWWCTVINSLIFDGELKPFRKIEIRKMKSWGYCLGKGQKSRHGRYAELWMADTYPSFSFFFSILAHELVHMYQFCAVGDMTHGPTFFKWSPKFRKVCIPLQHKY